MVAPATRAERAVAAAGGLGFVTLAAMVAAGALTRIDRYALRHLMPWAQPPSGGWLHLSSIFLPETRPTLGGSLVALWTYPASPFVSLLVVASCVFLLDRRGDCRAAVAAGALWVVANVVEVIAKAAIARPQVGTTSFHHSYPSGHTVRACVVAAVVGWTWRRAGPAATVWALLVPVALVLVGDHTPSDVAGGLLLSACLVAAARPSARRA